MGGSSKATAIAVLFNAKFSGRWQVYDELGKYTEL